LQHSFGQNGEDLVLNRILNGHQKGSYLDIGAYHPFKFSNTALLYKNGWTGINIDASDTHLELFFKYRPNDLSIQAAVTKDGGTRLFYEYKESAFNTFCDARVNELNKLGISPVRNLSVETVAFRKVVEKYAREDTFVLNIDIEGLDYSLLEDSVFEWFKPCIVIFESNTTIDLEITRLKKTPLLSDYVIICVAFNSFILRSINCELLHVNLNTDLEID
jgi:FkbM family methyltransferase